MPARRPPPRDLGPISRRRFLEGALAVGALGLPLAGGAGLRSARAKEAPEHDEYERLLEERRREAIRRGCAYIASKKNADGSFWPDNKATVAISALAVLALMAEGSTDGRGRYGDHVRQGIDFLLRCVTAHGPDFPWHEGYFHHHQDISSKMHGQGYATLALATALGTSTGRRYREIRDVVRLAVACIEQAQTGTGGFGYLPVKSVDHEGSVTVTVAQGLRAARDAGLLVNQDVVDRGLHYLKRSQKPDGSFRYSIHSDRSSYALTAAALSSFFLYGKYVDDPEDDSIARGLRYMMERIDYVLSTLRWYYYGHFYAAWACWQKDGDEWDPAGGGYWARWHRRVYPDLLRKQRSEDGGWHRDRDQFEFGDVLYTAFAVLTLAVPDEVLPIFQR